MSTSKAAAGHAAAYSGVTHGHAAAHSTTATMRATAERHGAGRHCSRAESNGRCERKDLPPHRSLSSY
jgi:hypothetical protein